LGRRQAELTSLNTDVVLISFGTPYWARVWREETGSPFPLLLDQERAAYRAYGLARSVWRSWGWNNMRYYARALWRGEKLRLNRGDTNQLGGDFIVDAQGLIRFAYPSHDPTDRPSLAQIVAVLQKLQE